MSQTTTTTTTTSDGQRRHVIPPQAMDRPRKVSRLFSASTLPDGRPKRRPSFYTMGDRVFGGRRDRDEESIGESLLPSGPGIELVDLAASGSASTMDDGEEGGWDGDGDNDDAVLGEADGVDRTPTFWKWGRGKRCCYVALVAFIVLAWCATNYALSFSNEYVFRGAGFRFPTLLVAFHALFGGVCSLLLLLLSACLPHIRERVRWLLSYQDDIDPAPARCEGCVSFKGIDPHRHGLLILLTGMFFALNTGFNNASFMYMPLGPIQIIRSLNIVFTAVFSVVFLKKRFTVLYWAGVFCISLGVMMSAYGNPTFDFVGAIFAFVSSVCAALMMVFVGKLTTMPGLEMDSINLVLWTALPIFGFCMVPFLMWEYTGMELYASANASSMVDILFSTALLAFLNNVLQYDLVRLTSPVYSTAASNVKTTGLFVIDYLRSDPSFGPTPTGLNWAGVSATMASFFYLNVLSYVETKPKAVPPPQSSSQRAMADEEKELKETSIITTFNEGMLPVE
jgi:drug/metabolite transporter (DMT)-like permease